jgi:hypothetical protein
MRALFLAVGAAAFCVMSSPGIAADMTMPKKAAVVRAPVEVACLRWVEQNYSWYNYCDPVPYRPRQNHNFFGEIF